MSRGPKWTDEELTLAFRLQAQGLQYPEIAERLGRTKGAIECKLQDARGGEGWNDAAVRRASMQFAADFGRIYA